MMRKGFTLVEMLLATLLIGVLTTFSILTFRSVSNGWQVSADYLDKMQRTDYALNQVVSGLRSMYYPHDGSQNEKYGFVLRDNGSGDDPERSDIIEWSKLGSAIVGSMSDKANSVHRVQIMVLEEGDDEYAEPIQKTGLYARIMRDSALGEDQDEDNTDLTFANADLYQPVLVADGITGFNCRVLKKREESVSGATDKKVYNTISSMFQFVRNGNDESITAQNHDSYNNYDPVTIATCDKAGTKVWFIQVDGREDWKYLGVTPFGMAQLALAVGGYNMTRFDGGGSSCMWVKGEGIVGHPSDRNGERSCMNYYLVRID